MDTDLLIDRTFELLLAGAHPEALRTLQRDGRDPEFLARAVLIPVLRSLDRLRGAGALTETTWRRARFGVQRIAGALARERRAQYVRIRRDHETLVARLHGPVVAARDVPIINTEIRRAVNAAGASLRRIEIDLGDVRSMCSMGIGMCLDLQSDGAGRELSVHLRRAAPEIDAVLQRLRPGGRRPRRTGFRRARRSVAA